MGGPAAVTSPGVIALMTVVANSPAPGNRSTGEGGVSPIVFVAGVIAFLVIVYLAYRWLSGGAGSARRPRSRIATQSRRARRRRR